MNSARLRPALWTPLAFGSLRASLPRLLLVAGLATACRGGEPRGDCDPSPPPGTLGTICGFSNPEDVAFVPAASLLLVSQMRHPGEAAEPPRSEAEPSEVHEGEAAEPPRSEAEPSEEGMAVGGSLAALSLDPEGEAIGSPRRLWPPAQATRESGVGATTGDPGCTAPPDAARFAPHGLFAATPGPDGEIPVAVVGHGLREAVELFALRGAGETATLRWTGCVPLPEDAVGNDVWLDERGTLWVTNYQPAMGGLRGLTYTIAGGLGLPTGEVLRWRASPAPASPSPFPGWESVADTRGANPNGLALMRGDGLAVAFTGSGSVRLLPHGLPPREIELGGHPDNLTPSSRATLLALVHSSGLASLRCRFGALPCTSPWRLMELDPATGLASQRFAHEGRLIGGVASVAEAGRWLYFGAIFDDRIGVLQQAQAP